MAINGKTRTCGLIGNPVEHTLSPVIHNNLAQKTNIDLVYVPFCVKDEYVKQAVEGAYGLNILGLNVTVPHKSAVIPYLQEIDELAQKIGAVNTLVRCENGYKGYNTDMTGLLRAMKSEGVVVNGRTVLLFGAGGAARAVAFLCLMEGAQKLYICNRTKEKAETVAKEVNQSFASDKAVAISLDELSVVTEDDLLAIQGTSVGLSPNDNDVVCPDGDIYDRITSGVDLVYRPYETMFMKLVKKHGGQAMNGLKMLLYQGIIAYELWNDISVSEDDAMQILQLMKKEMGINE